MELKKFINIILVAVIIILIGVANYFIFIRKSELAIEKTPSTKIPTSSFAQIENSASSTPILKNETDDWKIYRNEEYGFEVKYPQDLILLDSPNQEFIYLGEDVDEFRFLIYDANYIPSDTATAQEIRLKYRLINFSINKFSPKILEEVKMIENAIQKRISSTYLDQKEILPHKEKIGDYEITFLKDLGAAGPYPMAYFYNNQYFIGINSWQENLMKSIISTFKFKMFKTAILQQTIFPTQQECEQATGKQCGFKTCDFIPKGKTFEEVCGKDFRKGWQSVN